MVLFVLLLIPILWAVISLVVRELGLFENYRLVLLVFLHLLWFRSLGLGITRATQVQYQLKAVEPLKLWAKLKSQMLFAWVAVSIGMLVLCGLTLASIGHQARGLTKS